MTGGVSKDLGVGAGHMHYFQVLVLIKCISVLMCFNTVSLWMNHSMSSKRFGNN